MVETCTGASAMHEFVKNVVFEWFKMVETCTGASAMHEFGKNVVFEWLKW
jgi:hypothetical protein